MFHSGTWEPTTFLSFEEAYDTSMGTARIVTDAGPAYIKALGNRQGPHPLACEFVGTQLAQWYGLPAFDFALIRIDAEVDEIPFLRGGHAASGSAFVTRAVSGHPWGGSADELDTLINPEAVSWLVVFDTWTRNCDRYPPDLAVRKANYDNVFLEDAGEPESGRSRLVAMDHTHCFSCGRDLDRSVEYIDRIQDARLYGLFPPFVPRIRQENVEAALNRLRELDKTTLVPIVESIPEDWQVSLAGRNALVELIRRRAEFVADNLLNTLGRICWPGSFCEGTDEEKA